MDDFQWPLYASGLVTGFLFGFVLQRGGFCLTRAFSNLFLMGDTTILRAYVLALLVAMVGVQILLSLGLVEIPVRPFRWVANPLGGVLFGVGMIVSGGCSGSTWYRLGEGAVGAWVVLLGFAMGGTMMSVGILAPVRRELQQPTLTVGGASPTLANVTGLPAWGLLVPLVVLAGFWLLRASGEPDHGKWPWPLTGTAVGIMIAGGWWASSVGGQPTGITFTANTGYLLTYPLVGFPNRLNWGMLMLIGVAVGSFAAAWRAGEFRWKLPPGWTPLKLFGGGLLMGAAAFLGDGCNINQGLTNSATLAIGSLVTFLSMGAGAYLALWALYLRKG